MDPRQIVAMDPSGFVLLADFVPGIVQEIRYCSTYNLSETASTAMRNQSRC